MLFVYKNLIINKTYNFYLKTFDYIFYIDKNYIFYNLFIGSLICNVEVNWLEINSMLHLILVAIISYQTLFCYQHKLAVCK